MITDWLLAESSRLNRLEMNVSAQTDAWAEFDAQLQALQTEIESDDQRDADAVRARTTRLRDLGAALNPQNPAPAPGEPGAIEPNPEAPADLPSVDGSSEA